MYIPFNIKRSDDKWYNQHAMHRIKKKMFWIHHTLILILADDFVAIVIPVINALTMAAYESYLAFIVQDSGREKQVNTF